MSDRWLKGSAWWPLLRSPVPSHLPRARLGLDGYSCLTTKHALSPPSSSGAVGLGGTFRMDGVSWIFVIPGLRMRTPLNTPIDGMNTRT